MLDTLNKGEIHDTKLTNGYWFSKLTSSILVLVLLREEMEKKQ